MEYLESTPGAVEHIEQMARKPFVLENTGVDDQALLVAVPEGYRIDDLSKLMPAPARKSCLRYWASSS